ncbi:hypothetical protein AB0G06_07430 [Nonomuraea dietziae]|uniref:hypothetical protein n=1 Tax=Nonomuraea dietziae TaxID=65515 RepID=UPI0033F3AA15
MSDEAARRAPLPGSPLMSVAGLIGHLRWEAERAPWTEERSPASRASPCPSTTHANWSAARAAARPCAPPR